MTRKQRAWQKVLPGGSLITKQAFDRRFKCVEWSAKSLSVGTGGTGSLQTSHRIIMGKQEDHSFIQYTAAGYSNSTLVPRYPVSDKFLQRDHSPPMLHVHDRICKSARNAQRLNIQEVSPPIYLGTYTYLDTYIPR